MEYLFRWHILFGIDKEGQLKIEQRIKEDLESVNIVPCHTGKIAVDASIECMPFCSISGAAKCSCGRAYVKFEGSIEPEHNVIFEPVK